MVSLSTASPVAGSGHSAYGVGLALPHARITTAPLDGAAAVATGVASVSVLPAMFVITRVVDVSCRRWSAGSSACRRAGTPRALETVSVAVFDGRR